MNHQKVRNLLARSKKPVCKKQEGRLQEARRLPARSKKTAPARSKKSA
jgi:hypothetical protein